MNDVVCVSARQTVLLNQVHELMAQHSESFWDMFSTGETKEMRIFFLSLSRSDQHILNYVATVDALLGAD